MTGKLMMHVLGKDRSGVGKAGSTVIRTLIPSASLTSVQIDRNSKMQAVSLVRADVFRQQAPALH
jgi:hypothetical protein